MDFAEKTKQEKFDIQELIDRISVLENTVSSLQSKAQNDPAIIDSFAQKTTATPSAGYDGRFLINGKHVDYKDL